jgi:hypothetical protein
MRGKTVNVHGVKYILRNGIEFNNSNIQHPCAMRVQRPDVSAREEEGNEETEIHTKPDLLDPLQETEKRAGAARSVTRNATGVERLPHDAASCRSDDVHRKRRFDNRRE